MSPSEVAGGMTDPSAEAALAYPEPRRRSLQIYAVDPMIARLSGNEVVTITVPYEPLRPGPSGDLVQVIDYDASTKRLLHAGRPRRSDPAGAGRPRRPASGTRGSTSRWCTR